MPVPTYYQPAAWVGAGFLLLLALLVYGRQVARILRDGGQVRSDAMALPELLMSIVFAGVFAIPTIGAVLHHTYGQSPAVVKIDAVLPNSITFIIFTVGICGFMCFRGLDVNRVFGLDRLSPWMACGWACGLVLAAFPLAGAASEVTVFAMDGKVEPQPLVELFNTVARNHDYVAIGKIFASAAIIQPACEEFLFRGFFYGVWKRYLGAIGAGFLACLLFAAFHSSVSALAGLFVLAVCLNIAYERTGSLLVPIGMHALFNFASLVFIYAQAQGAVHP